MKIKSHRRGVGWVAVFIEPLEQRTLLSATVASAVSASAAAMNHAYVAGLIGTSQMLTPGEIKLEKKLTTQLNRGVSRQRVSMELLRSNASRRVQARAAYLGLLHRLPTHQQLRNAVGLLQSAGDSRALQAALMGSREYFRTRGGGTRQGFVAALYQDGVHRAPTADEQAAALRLLARGVSRTQIARRLLKTTEAQTLLIQATQASLGAGAPGPSSQDFLDLRRPAGLIRVQARAVSSDAAYQQIVNSFTAAQSLPGSSASTPPTFPVANGYNLTSGVQPTRLSSDFLFVNDDAISAGTDDVLWIGGQNAVYTYSPQTATTTQVAGLAAIQSISALDSIEAYATTKEGEIAHIVQGVVTALPALPNQDEPNQISASSDGIVWVLGVSGAVYQYVAGTQSWTAISTNGLSLSQISVGSADNIWALTNKNVVVRYTAASGFQTNSSLTGISLIQATAEGAVWIEGSGFVEMQPPGGAFQLVKAQPTDIQVQQLAAGSQNYAYAAGLINGSKSLAGRIDLIAVGVVDRQAVPFPTFTGAEATAYSYFNAQAHVTDIRADYDMPSIIDDMQNAVQNATNPGIDPTAFGAVRTELLTELSDVSDVYTRFGLVKNDILTPIQGVISNELSAANTAVGITVNDQPSEVGLILEGLLEALASTVSSSGIPVGAAVMAAFLSSGMDTAISAFQSANNLTPNQVYKVEYSNLLNQIDSLYTSALADVDSDTGAIVSDYGKLTAVEHAMTSGLWPYVMSADPTKDTATQAIQAATNAYEIYFYQSLTATRWQVVYSPYADYITYPVQQILQDVPSYDIYQVPNGYQDNVPMENVYWANGADATTSWNAADHGPFPADLLISSIQSLPGNSFNDFWTGQNGWDVIQHLPATD